MIINNLNGLIIDEYGNKVWYKNGEKHRDEGSALESINGRKEWWVNGQRHRSDGPAIETPEGLNVWYKNGKCHRTDGPAIYDNNEYKEWWVIGEQLTEEEFNVLVGYKKTIKLCNKRLDE